MEGQTLKEFITKLYKNELPEIRNQDRFIKMYTRAV